MTSTLTPSLDYLDLSLHPSRTVTTTDSFKHHCYVRSQSPSHTLHSGSGHLNTLTDLQIGLGKTIEICQIQNHITLKQLIQKVELQKQDLKDLQRNIDFLKDA